MADTLTIIAAGQRLGTVTRRGARLMIRYDPSWRRSPQAFPLSVAMPLVTGEHPHSVIDAFMRGLLPDSDQVLEQWAKRFHVSSRNPFKLLEHVGEECAGALQFVPGGRGDSLLGMVPKQRVTWLSKDELARRIRLFPALRSDPMALSGAFSGKQIPCSQNPSSCTKQNPSSQPVFLEKKCCGVGQ